MINRASGFIDRKSESKERVVHVVLVGGFKFEPESTGLSRRGTQAGRDSEFKFKFRVSGA
jgi:hypothetical protein